MNVRGGAGGSEQRRRIAVSEGPRAQLLATLARAMGVEVAADPRAEVDLRIVEAEEPEELATDSEAPTMVLATRRLKDSETVALRRAGARWVLDADASVLDAAFALSELLFETIAEQRRYWRSI